MKFFTKHGTHNNPVLKIAVMVLFIVIPIMSFVFGMQYQMMLSNTEPKKDLVLLTNEKKEEKINKKNPNVKTYFSSKLGISFSYLLQQEFPEGRSITVFENGNRVCVTYDPLDSDCKKGQFVEVFDKQKDESIEKAIERLFLSNKDTSRCFVTLVPMPKKYGSNFIKAEITFPEDKEFDLEKMLEKSLYCSEKYARTNGIRYFLMNTMNPTKLLFFSIGQYGISAENAIPWQETIKIL